MNIWKAFDLTGRVAFVTGGGSGIGKGCALLLSAAGSLRHGSRAPGAEAGGSMR